MKIDNNVRSLVAAMARELKKPAETSAAGSGDTPASENAFTVRLSEAASANDDIRIEKVEAIRRQLAEGKYNISGSDIASKLLESLKNG